MVNSVNTVKVLNGSSIRPRTSYGFSNTSTLLDRLEKTSFQCKGKSKRLCKRKKTSLLIDDDTFKPAKSKLGSKSNQLQESFNSNSSLDSRKFSGRDNSEYLPVPYGPYGYQDDVSEARSWITVPLFIIFSIIQFKLVAAIFLAFFGPMILFLLIVQGFLFKATLVMLGLMMS